jgi:hypothetical protein
MHIYIHENTSAGKLKCTVSQYEDENMVQVQEMKIHYC